MKNYIITYFVDSEDQRWLKRTDYIEAKNRARAIEIAKRTREKKWSFIVSELSDTVFTNPIT